MACEVARCTWVPDGLPGMISLGVASASIGKGIRGRLLPNKTTPANLFIMPGARPATGKSETMRLMAAPFCERQSHLQERWKSATFPGLRTDAGMTRSEIKQLYGRLKAKTPDVERKVIREKLIELEHRLGSLEDQLQGPRLLVEDITPQELAVQLSLQSEALASMSSDAGDVIDNVLGRYNKLDRPDESLYLKGFSWDPVTVDRRGRPSVQLNQPCLSVLWLVQPDKVQTLFGSRQLKEGGLLTRFRIAHFEVEPQQLSDDMPELSAAIVSAYGERINELLDVFRFGGHPVIVDATPEARRAMLDYANEISRRRKDDLADVDIFAGRFTELACRIAVCLHAARHGKDAGSQLISLETVQGAIEINNWFNDELLFLLESGRR